MKIFSILFLILPSISAYTPFLGNHHGTRIRNNNIINRRVNRRSPSSSASTTTAIFSVADLKVKLKESRKMTFLFDVRELDEWENAHLAVATPVPVSTTLVNNNGACEQVPPLVTKKSKNIISLWTPSPTNEAGLIDGPEVANNILAGLGRSCYMKYFGLNRYLPQSTTKEFLTTSAPLPYDTGKCVTHIFNLIGSDGENHVQTLIDNMASLQAAGEPMITTLKNVEVIDNPFYGIQGGWTLDLTIVANIGVPGKFVEQIPDDIATPPALGRDFIENGYLTNETFASVPNVIIANNDAPVPASMNQNINSWIIDYAWEGPLIGDDGKEKFGGFKKLFEDDTSSLRP